MPAPHNPFKAALKDGKVQIGCWLTLAEIVTAEIMGHAGYDWLVIDGEHGPNDIRSIRDQLMVLEPTPANAVVRLPIDETWMVKQALDAGAQNLLIPLIETAEQAEKMVSACRYPPHGVRGNGAIPARASQFNAITDYAETANDQICLLLQVETVRGMENLDAICNTDGVDGVFIGPADLSADMGHLGNPMHADVQRVIHDGLKRIAASPAAPGILMPDLDVAELYKNSGAQFIATGLEALMLADAARAKAAASREKLG